MMSLNSLRGGTGFNSTQNASSSQKDHEQRVKEIFGN